MEKPAVARRKARRAESFDSPDGSASDVQHSSGASTVHDASIPQILRDNGTYGPPDSDPPENLQSIMSRLERHRRSLSPAQSLKRTFEQFVRDNDDATNDASVLTRVLPHITGPSPHRSAQGIRFSNLKPLIAGDHPRLPPAQPSSYDGLDPSRLHPSIRAACQDQIVPSARGPILPNWFQESLGPDGRPDALRTHATHHGALGARAMDALQGVYENSLPPDHPPPARDRDRHAACFAATFLDGTLTLYATHADARGGGGGGGGAWDPGPPAYHTYRLASESLIGSLEQFRRGVRQFRNLRDYAAELRGEVVERAHAGRQQAAAAATRLARGGEGSVDAGLARKPLGRPSGAHRDEFWRLRRRDETSRTSAFLAVERARASQRAGYDSSQDEVYQSALEAGYENDDEREDDDDDEDSEY